MSLSELTNHLEKLILNEGTDDIKKSFKDFKIHFDEYEKKSNIASEKLLETVRELVRPKIEKKEIIKKEEKKDERRILMLTYVDGSSRFYRIIKETKCKFHVVRITEKSVIVKEKTGTIEIDRTVYLPGKKDSDYFYYFTKTPEGIKFEGQIAKEWTKELEQELLKPKY
jgi:hypothetical protein